MKARTLDNRTGSGKRQSIPGNVRDEGRPAGFRCPPLKSQRHLAIRRYLGSPAIARKAGLDQTDQENRKWADPKIRVHAHKIGAFTRAL
jgi:hypothetical protein